MIRFAGGARDDEDEDEARRIMSKECRLKRKVRVQRVIHASVVVQNGIYAQDRHWHSGLHFLALGRQISS